MRPHPQLGGPRIILFPEYTRRTEAGWLDVCRVVIRGLFTDGAYVFDPQRASGSQVSAFMGQAEADVAPSQCRAACLAIY